MLKNYLLIALRQMRRQWTFSVINVAGLALSMSVCLLILTLLNAQRGVDSFHEKSDRIVRMTTSVQDVNRSMRLATSAVNLGPELARQSPEVESLLQMRRSGGHLVREDGLRSSFQGIYATPELFEFFDFDLKAGSEVSALDAPFQVVLSSELAAVLFGDSNPVGRALEWQDVGVVTVSGVLQPPVEYSHLRADAFISFSTMESFVASGSDLLLSSWSQQTQFYNYLLLRPGADRSSIAELANTLAVQHHADTETNPPTYRVQELTSINLGADLSNQIARVMSWEVALVLSILAGILVIAAIFNYVNLTVARSVRRTREIGIRKVLGAERKQLLQQLVTESTVTALVAMLVAMALLAWLVPQFNALSAFSGDDMMQISGISPRLVLQFVAFAIVLGMLAGLLPALRMSRWAPAITLKGVMKSGSQRFGLRKALVVGQFAVSMVAIVMTLVIYRQAAFMMTAELGFDEADLAHLELQGLNYETVRSELMSVPGVALVAATSEPPSGGSRTWTDIRTQDMTEPTYMEVYSVSESFLDQYRIPLVAGQNLRVERDRGDGGAILLTESAALKLGYSPATDAIGESVLFDMTSRDALSPVSGIVADFYTNGLEDGQGAAVLHVRPERWRFASIRLEGDRTHTMSGIEEVWLRLAPGSTMRYKFFDDQVREGLSSMSDGVRILGLFAFLIMAIAGLGLFGMASYAAETRVREVGIRKVVGAEVGHLVSLLSRELLILVGLALVLAVPLAAVLSGQYLSLFAEHVTMGPWTLLLGVAPVLALALVTVGSQALRASLRDPVEVLRAE